jgi:hypothetical protein
MGSISMKENSCGKRLVNPNRDMAIYDHLSPELRHILQNTAFDFSAKEVSTYALHHGLKFAIKRILKVEEKALISVWGPDYPKSVH